ncbi:MAG TPA: 50S ribosomal protein L31 [Patescibacteria group bacterium]|nr:50S ribosomal protein L31 [Patescibacteria group bacterium]
MKKDIHPKWYDNAKVKCACGHTFTTGATVPEFDVEVCSNCHSFYTGNQKLVDTAGRVTRYQERLAKMGAMRKAKKSATPEKEVKADKKSDEKN